MEHVEMERGTCSSLNTSFLCFFLNQYTVVVAHHTQPECLKPCDPIPRCAPKTQPTCTRPSGYSGGFPVFPSSWDVIGRCVRSTFHVVIFELYSTVEFPKIS